MEISGCDGERKKYNILVNVVGCWWCGLGTHFDLDLIN